MEGLNLEQLGTAAITIGLLIYGLKMALEKINKHEETIEELHKQNTETLVSTMESHNAATKILDRAMDFFTKGENDHVQ